MVKITNVKYINPKGDPEKSFVQKIAPYENNNYEDLRRKIKANCPDGFVCLEPIALYHEIVYDKTGEHDRLRHAIEIEEYNATGDGELSVCVDIVDKESASGAPLLSRAPDSLFLVGGLKDVLEP